VVALQDHVHRALADAELDRLLAEGARRTDDELVASALGLDERCGNDDRCTSRGPDGLVRTSSTRA
jgi:hypothetical protein